MSDRSAVDGKHFAAASGRFLVKDLLHLDPQLVGRLGVDLLVETDRGLWRTGPPVRRAFAKAAI